MHFLLENFGGRTDSKRHAFVSMSAKRWCVSVVRYEQRSSRRTRHFFGVRIILLGTILGRFSIIYFRGLGLRIRVRVWV